MKEIYFVNVKRIFYNLTLEELTKLLEKLEYVDPMVAGVESIEREYDEGNEEFTGYYRVIVSSSVGGVHDTGQAEAWSAKCLKDLGGIQV